MDRRDFFCTPAKPAIKTAPVFRTQSGIEKYQGPWTANEVQHLLKRVMFGSTRSDIHYFIQKTLEQTVNELLSPKAPTTFPVNDYQGSNPDPDVAAGATWINSPTNDGNFFGVRRSSFKKWWIGQLLNQDRSIGEKLTLFWANHFGTETVEISNSHYVYWHHALLRSEGLGNFKQLVKKVTIDAGMLRYLNGYLNTKTAPDENYARELQELFTIGKNSQTGLSDFTEDDVKKAAKVLTGWRINGTTYTVYFDPNRHDTSNKTFSSFYNNVTITGRSGSNGAQETDDLINMLFQKNETALFIVRKLYRWFVYYQIDAATEANVIKPLADIFRNNNYEIKPVLAALFSSQHFFDTLNQGCFIKSPADKVIGCLREMNVKFPDPVTEYSHAYGMYNYILGWMTTMSQSLGDPPNVSGWPAYYQEPQFHELWINADTLPKRNRFTDTMIFTGYTRQGKKIIIDAVAFAKQLTNPADPEQLLSEIISLIYRVPLSTSAKKKIKEQILLSNQTADYYWTNAWVAHTSNPGDTSAYNIVNSRLRTLLQYLMNLAEYQLS